MVQCSESCGWLTGTIAAFAFGSFGVPIKAVSNLNVDPMVLQVRVLLTSSLFLLLISYSKKSIVTIQEKC